MPSTFRWVVLLVLAALSAPDLHAQETESYSRLNSFSGFAEYSDTSSHVHWGVSRRRKLTEAGVTYSRRMPHVLGGLTRYGSWYYEVELIPLAFLRDPTVTISIVDGTYSGVLTGRPVAVCKPSTFIIPGEYSQIQTCGGQWTYLGGFKPVGLRYNFLPKHRVQPFLDSHLGMLVSPRDVPVDTSSRANFTFEFGAGVEFFRDHARSIAVEYRLHHLSNDYLSQNNPGVDSQLLKVTYSFGRR